jgi:hypothetical protein
MQPRILLDMASAIDLYDDRYPVCEVTVVIPRDEYWEQVIGSYVPGEYVQIGVENSEAVFTGVIAEIDITTSTVTVVA